MNLQPLDLEKSADEIMEIIYPTYRLPVKSYVQDAMKKKRNLIKLVFKQRLKSACEFYKKWRDNPKTFIMWYEDKEKVKELMRFMEHWFGEFWRDKFDNLENERIEIILKYNEWLFRLAFRDVLGDDKK